MKNLTFALVAAIFAGLSSNAQTLKDFTKIDIGFGKVSSYAGPCVSGAGMCMGGLSGGTPFDAGIANVGGTQIAFAFSKNFYQANAAYLRYGLETDSFSLPRSVSEPLGIKGEYIVAKGTYTLSEKDGYYYVWLPRQR